MKYKKIKKIALSITIFLISLNIKSVTAEDMDFFDDFESINITNWKIADGWGNGAPFGCYWDSSTINILDCILTISVENESKGGYDFIGGEYRRKVKTHYGLYEISMKPGIGSGLMSGSFFTHTGPYENNPHDEIDIEFLGKDTSIVQFNYFRDGKSGREHIYELGFDSTENFHTYAFRWAIDKITWYVDGKEVYYATEELPELPGKILLNIWPGDGSVNNWLGEFDSDILPTHAEYEWVRFTPEDNNSSEITSFPTIITVTYIFITIIIIAKSFEYDQFILND